jgi:hypothetical protein
MKEVMAKESSAAHQGVPSFEYDPSEGGEPFLFDPYRPLDDLKESLVEDFADRQLTMLQVYEEHSVGTPFIKKNYKQALMDLEGQGKISARPPAKERKKGTFADRVLVAFPSVPLATNEFGLPRASAG